MFKKSLMTATIAVIGLQSCVQSENELILLGGEKNLVIYNTDIPIVLDLRDWLDKSKNIDLDMSLSHDNRWPDDFIQVIPEKNHLIKVKPFSDKVGGTYDLELKVKDASRNESVIYDLKLTIVDSEKGGHYVYNVNDFGIANIKELGLSSEYRYYKGDYNKYPVNIVQLANAPYNFDVACEAALATGVFNIANIYNEASSSYGNELYERDNFTCYYHNKETSDNQDIITDIVSVSFMLDDAQSAFVMENNATSEILYHNINWSNWYETEEIELFNHESNQVSSSETINYKSLDTVFFNKAIKIEDSSLKIFNTIDEQWSDIELVQKNKEGDIVKEASSAADLSLVKSKSRTVEFFILEDGDGTDRIWKIARDLKPEVVWEEDGIKNVFKTKNGFIFVMFKNDKYELKITDMEFSYKISPILTDYHGVLYDDFEKEFFIAGKSALGEGLYLVDVDMDALVNTTITLEHIVKDTGNKVFNKATYQKAIGYNGSGPVYEDVQLENIPMHFGAVNYDNENTYSFSQDSLYFILEEENEFGRTELAIVDPDGNSGISVISNMYNRNTPKDMLEADALVEYNNPNSVYNIVSVLKHAPDIVFSVNNNGEKGISMDVIERDSNDNATVSIGFFYENNNDIEIVSGDHAHLINSGTEIIHYCYDASFGAYEEKEIDLSSLDIKVKDPILLNNTIYFLGNTEFGSYELKESDSCL